MPAATTKDNAKAAFFKKAFFHKNENIETPFREKEAGASVLVNMRPRKQNGSPDPFVC
jgi:hypothetical protein